MEPFLSKYQSRFRQGYSAQCCLLYIIKKWKSTIDKGACFGALLTDLSKTFFCLLHEVLSAALQARSQGGQRVPFPISAFWETQ